MATPTIQDFTDAKRDLDDLEKIINLPNPVPTRLGGNKLSVDQALSQIIVGEVSVYSAASIYAGIEDWVEYNGVVYRPLPSALPIGPESFDGSKWAANLTAGAVNYRSEVITIVDGVLDYTLSTIDLDANTARVEIAKAGGVSGGTLLIKDVDYTADDSSVITLNSSYPDGYLVVSNFAPSASSVLSVIPTTLSLVQSPSFAARPAGSMIEVLGYSVVGDGGAGRWVKTGISGLSPSLEPKENNGKLTDSGGNEYKLAPVDGTINLKQLGCIIDDSTDDRSAAIAAGIYADNENISALVHSGGSMYLSGYFSIGSKISLMGHNSQECLIRCPTQALRNLDWDVLSGGNSNITIEGIGFNADSAATSILSFNSCSSVTIKGCRFFNVGDDGTDGVTASIGIGAKNGVTSRYITITENYVQSNDYCIVLDADALGSGLVERFIVSDNHIDTQWGSGVSISGNVKQGKIVDNSIYVNGEGGALAPAIRGLGIKVWNGKDSDHHPEFITISGNDIKGQEGNYGSILGVTLDNWTDDIAITGNTFNNVESGVLNNFAETASNIVISGNTFSELGFACRADASTDTGIVFSDNKCEGIATMYRGSLRSGSIANNRAKNLSGSAIELLNATDCGVIAANTFFDIDRNGIDMQIDSASSANVSITGNTFRNVSQSANGAYSALSLNNQAHTIVGNTFITDTANKPNYIIADGGSPNWRNISSNWFFGASIGYIQNNGADDVYANNIERGL